MDDLIYCDLPSEIHKAYKFLLELLPQSGLDINRKKLIIHITSMICMGIFIDSETRTMSVPSEKLEAR